MSAREQIATVLRERGWTCEYHAPDATCSACRDLHLATADAILEALAAERTAEVAR